MLSGNLPVENPLFGHAPDCRISDHLILPDPIHEAHPDFVDSGEENAAPRHGAGDPKKLPHLGLGAELALVRDFFSGVSFSPHDSHC